jgi:flagellar hook-associated protein 1 FlgK
MSLDTSLSIATSGIANINQAFTVISQNIANANTPGYAMEQTTGQSLVAGGLGFGVINGPTTLLTDQALLAEVFQQNANATSAQTTSNALSTISTALGAVGSGNDLGSLVTSLQNSFSALLNDPASSVQQEQVVSAAQSLTAQINAISASYAQASQGAQNGLQSGIASLTTDLQQVGSLSNQIIDLKASGQSTADLENQRNQVLSSISNLTDARFAEQPNGDMLVFTASGVQLPTRGTTMPSITAATTGATAYYPGGGLPGIMLGGQDITAALTGGSIGANLALRDTTIPTCQAQLDEFSETLATRFSAQGLTLFSDPNGNVPAGGGTPVQSGYVGFSSIITVNPAVVTTPSLVRDGTQAVAGSPTGASAFTPNPNNLPGFTTMIDRVLNYSLGTQVQAGVTQPAPNVTGLGPNGNLSAGFAAPDDLVDFANTVTSTQAASSAAATSDATEQQATQTTLTGNLTAATGVDMDSQISLMVQLQNAYGANAKILTTIESMYSTLLQAVSA